MKRTLGLLPLIVLAGCASSAEPMDNIGPSPANYRDMARAHIRSHFYDPYSVRDVEVSQPFLGGTVINDSMESGRGWVVCVRANAKNRFGAYTGTEVTLFVAREGRVVHTIGGGAAAMHCVGALYDSIDMVAAR